MLSGYVFRAALRLKPATVRSCIASVQRFASTLDDSLVRRVKHLAQESDERLLTVSWNDGTTNRYPFVYLRDICRCPECFHDSSLQRTFDSVAELHSGLIATKVDKHEDGKQIKLIWPNKHVTIFDADWLYERRLPEANEQHAEKVMFTNVFKLHFFPGLCSLLWSEGKGDLLALSYIVLQLEICFF